MSLSSLATHSRIARFLQVKTRKFQDQTLYDNGYPHLLRLLALSSSGLLIHSSKSLLFQTHPDLLHYLSASAHLILMLLRKYQLFLLDAFL
jgi:hypothetical protein